MPESLSEHQKEIVRHAGLCHRHAHAIAGRRWTEAIIARARDVFYRTGRLARAVTLVTLCLMGSLARFVRRLRYGPPIVVVSGLPRSGTSLMMQMLHAGGLDILSDAVRTPDRSNPKGYYELEAVKDLDKGGSLAWLAGARGKGVKIVSPLLRWLPESHDYRVVFMQRNLDEVIASQNTMLAARGAPQDEGQNERIRQLYQTQIENTLRLLRRRRGFSTLVVDYGETVAHPFETARRVGSFLGLRLDMDRMAAVVDPALHRNRTGTA